MFRDVIEIGMVIGVLFMCTQFYSVYQSPYLPELRRKTLKAIAVCIVIGIGLSIYATCILEKSR